VIIIIKDKKGEIKALYESKYKQFPDALNWNNHNNTYYIMQSSTHSSVLFILFEYNVVNSVIFDFVYHLYFCS